MGCADSQIARNVAAIWLPDRHVVVHQRAAELCLPEGPNAPHSAPLRWAYWEQHEPLGPSSCLGHLGHLF